jgi:glycerol-3-phosphate dehydrogenase
VLQERSTLFSNIHSLIGEYKRKISLLGHEKKEVERKYKQLKEKVSRHDEHSEHKLIELYTEKIDVLQKLTEKQQAEIENTIELYEVELIKIEERRREEIEVCQN